MSPVKDAQRIAAKDLKPGGPYGEPESDMHAFIGYLPSALAQSFHRVEHRGGVVHLMAAQKRNGIFDTAIGKALSVQALADRAQLREIDAGQRYVLLGAHRSHHIRNDLFAVVAYRAAARLDNAGLVGRNGLKRAAEILRMLETHVGDHGRLRRGDRVGSVQSSAHAHLQYDDVAPAAAEILDGQRGHEFELAGMVLHRLGMTADQFGKLCEILSGNVFPVDLDPLTEFLDVRGCVKSRFVSGLTQNGGEHGAGAPLAVAARNMDKADFILRISQAVQQLNRPLQSESCGTPGVIFDIIDGFLFSHNSSASPKSFYPGASPAAP